MRANTALILCLAAVGGCASPSRRAATADKVRLPVPFYADDADQGGPASLAALLSFWDKPTEPRQLRDEVYRPRLRGTLPIDLLLAAQERGLQARSYQATATDVRTELKLGYPVLAFVDIGPKLLRRGQFVVITGFDDARGGFYVHSHRRAHRFVDYRAFMERWDKTGRWAILITPAGAPAARDSSAARVP